MLSHIRALQQALVALFATLFPWALALLPLWIHFVLEIQITQTHAEF
jgi:hypothetical protein